MPKLITLENKAGPYHAMLLNIMRMVPDRDKQDIDLQRLLAFRLRLDGESATREYLIRKVRDMIQCAYSGRLYDFLKGDAVAGCRPAQNDSVSAGTHNPVDK